MAGDGKMDVVNSKGEACLRESHGIPDQVGFLPGAALEVVGNHVYSVGGGLSKKNGTGGLARKFAGKISLVFLFPYLPYCSIYLLASSHV